MQYFFTTKVTGDMKQLVAKQALAKQLRLDIKQLYYMQQVHGSRIVLIDDYSPNIISSCDAMISTKINIALLVLVADCIPVLIFDKIKGVIAAVHAGRSGIFLNIVNKTIKKIQTEFGSQVENIQVILGPHIKQCCYEVDEKLTKEVKKLFGQGFMQGRYLDLMGIVIQNLLAISLKRDQIISSNICTKCSNSYFSYRNEKDARRFAGVISNISTL